jgi:hypothetical protein
MPVVNQITKIVFRRGLLSTGKTVILNQGEPGYTYDTKRLYVGDGATPLGTPAGIYNYGIRNFSTLNFNLLSGGEIGDIVYDDVSNHMYFLTAYPGSLRNNWAKVDVVVDTDNYTIELNTLSAIQVMNYGIRPIHLNASVVGTGLVGAAGSPISVVVDNNYIIIDNNKISLNPGAIDISVLGAIAPVSILGNTKNFSAPIEEIQIDDGTVLGKFGGTLGGIPFATIVTNGGGINLVSFNGGLTGQIDNSSIPFKLIAGLDSNNIDLIGTPITLKRATRVTGDFTCTGTLRSQGDIIAFFTSDINLKNKVEEINNSTNKLKQLRGVTFEWKESGERDVGVIAQEVEQVLPEAVITRDTGIKAVNYDKLIPLLINTIKELEERINILENKV